MAAAIKFITHQWIGHPDTAEFAGPTVASQSMLGRHAPARNPLPSCRVAARSQVRTAPTRKFQSSRVSHQRWNGPSRRRAPCGTARVQPKVALTISAMPKSGPSTRGSIVMRSWLPIFRSISLITSSSRQSARTVRQICAVPVSQYLSLLRFVDAVGLHPPLGQSCHLLRIGALPAAAGS
jgi:hypothetical protein